MYEALGICVALATLLSINAFVSLVTSTLWRLLATPALRLSAHTRATILFTLRVGPPSLAFLTVGALLIPSYLIYEPPATSEVASNKLVALALVSAIGVVFALCRGLKSWLATRMLLREWLARAEQIRIDGIEIPAFRIRHPFPVIAVVGSIRPRLFVASQVLESLSDEEMSAAIAHEYAHLAARDNLKRVLIRACRDMLTIVPCGRKIDRAWEESSEAAADESAANRGSAVALNLAAALIQITRMVPAGARPAMPIASYQLGEEPNGVMGRVRQLLVLSAQEGRDSSSSKFFWWAGRAVTLASLFGLILLSIALPTLSSLHAAMEQVVRLLS